VTAVDTRVVTTIDDREDDHEWGPLHHPRQAGGLRDVFRQRYLLWLLVRKEAKLRYQGSFLGLLWSYVLPLTRFCVYYFIAVGVLGRGAHIPNRALHIFSGMIIMQLFQTSLAGGSKAIIKNRGLLRKVNIPREMFPVASVAVSIYNLVPLYVVMIAGDYFYSWHPDLGALYASSLAFAIAVVYGLGLAILLSAINVFVRDTGNAVDVVNTVLRWTAPVIYTYSMILPKIENHPLILQMYICNPFNAAVMLNNRAFWIPSFPQNPDTPNVDPIQAGMARELPAHLFERGLIVLAAGFVFVAVAELVFSRVEGGFADKL
jgi:ABC-2 type transport system permease protein